MTSEEQDPGLAKVQNYLLYGLSLPERMLRSTTALVGGVLRESTQLLLPQAFRSSRTYSIFVQQMLDFMVVQVGGVNGPAAPDSKSIADSASTDNLPAATPQVENFVARKAVGNFVELAGMATLHLSPLTVLAVVSDVAYGSKIYLKELSDELKRQGVIQQETTIDHVADLLNAVSHASGVTAQAFDTPPLSVDGLQKTIDQTREALKQVDPTKAIPQAELTRLWDEMHTLARNQGVSVWDMSSAMTLYTLNRVGNLGQGALSTVTVAGNMFDRHILEHYSNALLNIREKGFYASLADSSRPYMDAMWKNFSTDKATITENLFNGRLISKALGGVRGFLGIAEADEQKA